MLKLTALFAQYSNKFHADFMHLCLSYNRYAPQVIPCCTTISCPVDSFICTPPETRSILILHRVGAETASRTVKRQRDLALTLGERFSSVWSTTSTFVCACVFVRFIFSFVTLLCAGIPDHSQSVSDIIVKLLARRICICRMCEAHSDAVRKINTSNLSGQFAPQQHTSTHIKMHY